MPVEIQEGIVIPDELETNVFVTNLDKLYNWSRKSSMWPLLFGLACCAIEMICTAASRYDLGRFGMEIMRASPRQADLMIVSGTVTKKMVPTIVRIYNQMAEPRYVLSMGACATGGGPFKEGYNVVSGIDKFLPVDVYVPGCPPTPEALLHGILKLHEKVERQSLATVPWYNKNVPVTEVPVPLLGPDLVDLRRVDEIASGQPAPLVMPAVVKIKAIPAAKPVAKPAAPAAAPKPTAAPAKVEVKPLAPGEYISEDGKRKMLRPGQVQTPAERQRLRLENEAKRLAKLHGQMVAAPVFEAAPVVEAVAPTAVAEPEIAVAAPVTVIAPAQALAAESGFINETGNHKLLRPGEVQTPEERDRLRRENEAKRLAKLAAKK